MDTRTAPEFSKDDASTEPRWYTIHTYAGYENAVERNLKQRIESLGRHTPMQFLVNHDRR